MNRDLIKSLRDTQRRRQKLFGFRQQIENLNQKYQPQAKNVEVNRILKDKLKERGYTERQIQNIFQQKQEEFVQRRSPKPIKIDTGFSGQLNQQPPMSEVLKQARQQTANIGKETIDETGNQMAQNQTAQNQQGQAKQQTANIAKKTTDKTGNQIAQNQQGMKESINKGVEKGKEFVGKVKDEYKEEVLDEGRFLPKSHPLTPEQEKIANEKIAEWGKSVGDKAQKGASAIGSMLEDVKNKAVEEIEQAIDLEGGTPNPQTIQEKLNRKLEEAFGIIQEEDHLTTKPTASDVYGNYQNPYQQQQKSSNQSKKKKETKK